MVVEGGLDLPKPGAYLQMLLRRQVPSLREKKVEKNPVKIIFLKPMLPGTI